MTISWPLVARTLSLPRLDQLRIKALRQGVWFQVLTDVERGIVRLTLRCMNKIRSSLLYRTLTHITAKLVEAMQFTRRLEQLGRPIAALMSQVATRWGNRQAEEWSEDQSFIQFLGLQALSHRLMPFLQGVV